MTSRQYIIDLCHRAETDEMSNLEMALIFLAGAGLGAVALQVYGILKLIF